MDPAYRPMGVESMADMCCSLKSCSFFWPCCASLRAVSDLDDSYAQTPGGPGRWTLATDETGLENMANVYHTVSLLANDITLYTTLQGITMQLLIIRLIRVLSAQKRLSILTSTAIKVCCLPVGNVTQLSAEVLCVGVTCAQGCCCLMSSLLPHRWLSNSYCV